MSNKFELFEDCLKRNYRAGMLEKGGEDRLCVWMELCRDTVLQNCLTQTKIDRRRVTTEHSKYRYR